MRIDGWTITYFVLAGLFCIGLTEPGIMAAVFWAGIGITNFLINGLDKPHSTC